MMVISDKTQCCGCSACFSACPYDAISMVPDKLGFRYPVTDGDKCVGCGLCEKVCAFVKERDAVTSSEAKAIRNKEVTSLMDSRRGGVFPVLAEHVISKGGTVYGAAFDGCFNVVHARAESMAEADAFRGSKYVQSHMGDIFRKVREDLHNGLHVLFSGTPCQVDGLRSFLPERLKSRLVLVDIVCHGVPSPDVWRANLEYQKNRHEGDVEAVEFRDKKEYGWAAHKETYRIAGKKITDTSYTYLFYRHIMLRPSCSVCPYASLSRVSDITLADFWGWQKAVPGFNDDDRGVSLVLLNTGAGRVLMQECQSRFDVRDVEIGQCLQPNLRRPSSRDKDSERFADDFAARGFAYVLKRYGDKGWRYKVYTFYMNCKRMVKGWLGK